MILRLSFSLLAAFLSTASIRAAENEPTRIFKDGEKSADSRLGKPKTLDDYFPFTPPTSKESWNDRKHRLREQVLVANGLWPLPEKRAMNPVIHGKIERQDYTVEKVFFASMPGHYVSGNLYRPTAKSDGKRPAVLSPHGHWTDGRFYDAGEATGKKQIEAKAEQTMEGARYPLQARCAQLAKMGFVVFHYDMVGYADSRAIVHRVGFTDVAAELWLHNFMGLQTWNTVRSLDFLASLPDVDPQRIGVTGASGGGTQTFILDAIDDRPAAAFPAVMVSTAMQGGCVCENCSYLRVGTGNVELAGLFAPKPQGMSGAHDWTIDVETKGLPQLKQLYKLLGAEDLVMAKCYPQFPHNYNQVSRELMYNWFNQHLLMQKSTIHEEPFVPINPKELSVYDEAHPRPKDERNAEELRKVMVARDEKWLQSIAPSEGKNLQEFRRAIGTALRVMIHDELPGEKDVVVRQGPEEVKLPDGLTMHKAILGRKDELDAIPAVAIYRKKGDTVVIWVHPKGKASLFEKDALVPAAKALIEKGCVVLAADLFRTGELHVDPPFSVNPKFAGFTFGYNRSVLANRVHDVLTSIGFAEHIAKAKRIHLIGWDEAGPWTVLAAAMSGDSVHRIAVDLQQFRFENIKATSDEMMLPGAVKYGGLPAFLALCAPQEMLVHNHKGTSSGHLTKAAYGAAGAKEKLHRFNEKLEPMKVVEWLLK